MSVEVIHSIADLRRRLSGVRSIGLVPTMGALHAGHGKLIEQAAAECGCVVVSVFVNPIQFNDQKDFALYPRTLDTDVKFCERLGAHIVFAPAAEEMYPRPLRTFVEVTGLTERLCGEFRPGHFRGVTTVVMKLFQIVQPHRAYFGEKDAQQLAVIRRMVRDLDVPVAIIGVPTVREADGLAMSSRNQRLSPEERALAPAFYKALEAAETSIRRGARDPREVKRAAECVLQQAGLKFEYMEIVDPLEIQPVERIDGAVLIAGAVWVGGTRLIDNITVSL